MIPENVKLCVGMRLRRDGPYEYEGTIIEITGSNRSHRIVLQVVEHMSHGYHIPGQPIVLREVFIRNSFILSPSTALAYEEWDE